MAYTRQIHPVSGEDLAQVTRDFDGATVPVGVDTPESLAYAAWCAAGNVPEAAAMPPPPTTFTGHQWAFAIGDLGLAEAFLAALASSKAKDRHRYGLIGRETVLRPDDPLLVRICGRDEAALDLPSLCAHARTMPR